MELVIVRHAIAVDREEFAKTHKDDDLRPLTPDGQRKMREGAKGLRAMIEGVDVLAPSPLTRAMQTAEILATAFDMQVTETTDTLRPDSKHAAFEQWLRKREGKNRIMVVGHEPHLSELVSWLLTGGTSARFDLKKGGACLLSFDGAARRGKATLEWLLAPSQLRKRA